MMKWTRGASPRHLARIAGGLYLIIIVGGFFAIGYVPAAIVVPGDAAATAHNILAHELLYRLGLAAHIIILPSPNSGRAAGDRSLVLPDQQFRDLCCTRVRGRSVPLHPGAFRRGGTIAVPVAPPDGRERFQMGEAGEPRLGTRSE